ncbi:MAG: hypothetical protein ABSH51_02900 [Solirubrobacteraceae bacterium]|jgi:MFS family permease
MLASITPLGERSRGFSWRLTATAFAVAAVAAGALAGAALGAIGSLLPGGSSWRGVVLAAALVVAAVCDATPLRRRLPSSRRQVNEDWLRRYRGWVYGAGFGAQFGLGVATIVTSAAVYAAVAATLLCGSVAVGALIGAGFGVVRALSLVPAGAARDPAALFALHRRLERAQRPVSTVVVVLELVVAALVVAWVA